MTTAILTHDACLAHLPGVHHPESPHRLNAVLKALRSPEFEDLSWFEAPQISREHLELVHPKDHIDHVLSHMPVGEAVYAFDGDTVASPGTQDAVLRAAGGVTRAVDLVLQDGYSNAFCAVRPPGHHAEPDVAMGFCFFNNVAIGAKYAQFVHGLGKVAVIDFDVHHGNGTQAAFWRDASVFYGSSHQGYFYPGTGLAGETGLFGNVVNVPVPAGSHGEHIRSAYANNILPKLQAFEPQLILISAGFDAHQSDPLAGLQLDAEDFGWLTERIYDIAEAVCEGRVISVLEGGYDLEALSQSVRSHVGVLMARATSAHEKMA